MPKKIIKTAARITIESPGTMSPKGRQDIVKWLRTCASHLSKHGKNYTHGKFRASFNYTPH